MRIGDHTFPYVFQVIPLGLQKVIIGNDIVIEQDAVIYQGREYTEINQKAIPCHNISDKSKHGKIRHFADDKNSLRTITEHQDTSGLTYTSESFVKLPIMLIFYGNLAKLYILD